jgi:DNA repair exonuclease SbcCD ATPase subunit
MPDSQPFDIAKANELAEAVREYRVYSMQEICRKTFPAAIKEIERLEAKIEELRNIRDGWIKIFNEKDKEIERFKAEIDEQGKEFLGELNNARRHIQELEANNVKLWSYMKTLPPLPDPGPISQYPMVVDTAIGHIKRLEAELAEMHSNALEVAGFITEKRELEALLGKAKEALIEERGMVIFCHDPRKDRTEEQTKHEAASQLKAEYSWFKEQYE